MSVCMHACACIHVCVSAPKAINNYSGLMWCDIDPMWFANKFYGFYMVDVDVCISSHLKEELAWATDKRLWVFSTSKELKGTKE